MGKEKQLDKNLVEKILKDSDVRKAVVYKSHNWFFHLYFNHYVTFETAPFQHEMIALTEDENYSIYIIIAFRGSSKSTLINMSYPLWAILGCQQKKFIIILGQTQDKAQYYFSNIKKELEENELLKQDLGPFQEDNNHWGSYSLVVPRFNAKIIVGSVEQSIRGLRHRQYRPDLIILDDVENVNSVRTKEGRDKTWQWLTGEVMPAGDRNTKIVALGNLLHEDSLLKRLHNRIIDGKIKGVYKEYPLLDDSGKPLWPGKFKTQGDIDFERETKAPDNVTWQREYMLKIIPEEDQVIKPDWIKYYEALPSESEYDYTGIGMDLAISQTSTADFTAMVPGRVYGHNKKDRKLYIMPNIVNKRLTSMETIEEGMLLADTQALYGQAKLFIEDVAYQRSIIEHFEGAGYDAEGVKIYGANKISRLKAASHWLESGKVLFPRQGAEDLINQLVNFGVEKYDDIADAFTILLMQVIKEHNRPEFIMGFGRIDAI